MSEWKPVSFAELNEIIQSAHFDGELLRFWQLIRVEPTKWSEKSNGAEGGGFWIVGIFGSYVLWYSDIEEGFNISDYNTFGQINQYDCNQDKLIWTVSRLFDYVKLGEMFGSKRGGPEKLS